MIKMTSTNSLSVGLFTSSLTMTSLEVSSLTGKRHDHVLRDIDQLVKKLSPDLGVGYSRGEYKGNDGKLHRLYNMDADSVYNLLLGYDPNARMKVVKRLRELETKSNSDNLQLEARKAFTTYVSYYLALSYSSARAKQLAAKDVKDSFGIDLFSDVQLAIPNLSVDDVFLIPSDIAGPLHSKANRVNKLLEELNLQYYKDGSWYPTKKALDLGISKLYEYVRNGHSGTSLSWNKRVVLKMFNDAGYVFSKDKIDTVPALITKEQAESMSLINFITRPVD